MLFQGLSLFGSAKAGHSNSAHICGSTVRRAEIQRNNITTVELSFERGSQQQLTSTELPAVLAREVITRVHRCTHATSYRCSDEDFDDELLLCYDPALQSDGEFGRCYSTTAGRGGCVSCFGEERNGTESRDYQKCQDPDTAREGDSIRCGDTCQLTEMETIVSLGQNDLSIVKQVQRGCANSMPEQTVHEHVFICEESQCLYNETLVAEVAGCGPETTTTTLKPTTTSTTTTMKPTTVFPSTTTASTQTDNSETVIVGLSITVGILFALLLIIVIVMLVWCRNNERKKTSRPLRPIKRTAQPTAIPDRIRATISIRRSQNGTEFSNV